MKTRKNTILGKRPVSSPNEEEISRDEILIKESQKDKGKIEDIKILNEEGKLTSVLSEDGNNDEDNKEPQIIYKTKKLSRRQKDRRESAFQSIKDLDRLHNYVIVRYFKCPNTEDYNLIRSNNGSAINIAKSPLVLGTKIPADFFKQAPYTNYNDGIRPIVHMKYYPESECWIYADTMELIPNNTYLHIVNIPLYGHIKNRQFVVDYPTSYKRVSYQTIPNRTCFSSFHTGEEEYYDYMKVLLGKDFDNNRRLVPCIRTQDKLFKGQFNNSYRDFEQDDIVGLLMDKELQAKFIKV